VEEGGLGEFDTSLWEEVEGSLPEGYILHISRELYDRCKELMNNEWTRQAANGVIATSVQVEKILHFQGLLKEACENGSMFMVNSLINSFVIEGLDLDDLRLNLLLEADKGFFA